MSIFHDFIRPRHDSIILNHSSIPQPTPTQDQPGPQPPIPSPQPPPPSPQPSIPGPQPSIPGPQPSQPGPQPSQNPSDSSSGSVPTSTFDGSTIFTTTIPITVTQPTTTFTSFTESIVTQFPTSVSVFSSTTLSSSTSSTSTPIPAPLSGLSSSPVCPGDGLDAASIGVLASVLVPTAFGLAIWVIFAIVRPRFKQVYALREWFVQSDLRPKPLGSSFFSFLFPPVPLVPDVPTDASDAGRSAAEDAKLFPSDEELSQRGLWVALMIVLGWSLLALGGALPIYLVDMPCNAQLPSSVTGLGGYSTISDLSLLRLLRLIDAGNAPDVISLERRGILSSDDPHRARLRVIILTILTVVLGVLPMLFKLIREFNRLVDYRQRWLLYKCESKDLGWLSVKNAPGFKTWGEKQLKDYLVKIGLSSTLGDSGRKNANGGARPRNGARGTRRRDEELPLTPDDEARAEVDIQSLFSIGDTQRLALLIEERDEILENLEIAETKYISSFRITTPDPSILDFVPPAPADPSRPYISRPLPLAPQQRRPRARRHMNRAYGTSSLAPTSFVAPSSYYKLRGVQGVSGGRFGDASMDRHQSLSESINTRMVGSRFMEGNRNSVAYGRLPLANPIPYEKSEAGPSRQDSWSSQIPDPRYYGPNFDPMSYENLPVDEHGVVHTIPEKDEEWVDLSSDNPEDFNTDYNGLPPDQAHSFFRRARPPKAYQAPSTRHESFPMRDDRPVDPDTVLPPHLRLQPSQPFVRPLDGMGYEQLGDVYTDITQWRSRLKGINKEIMDAQTESYNDIASGTNITGWLLVGRGLRHIPGVEIIEGRAKEDIRWDVLQNERTGLDRLVMWTVIVGISVAMAAALTAAAGLAVSPAPDVAHYLPFFRPLLTTNPIAAGVATVFAPALAAILFLIIGFILISRVVNIHGSVSISGNQLLMFKITFFVLVSVAAIWLIGIGAVLFSIGALTTSNKRTANVTSGAIYMSLLALSIILSIAVIVPGCLLLQPFRLWRVLQAEKAAITPRQRFRAVYPRTYNPTYAIGACILAILFASTFAIIFPLIAPAVFILLLLSLIAHRYLIGYVYARTHSQTGGLVQIWMLRRFGTLLSFQPILLGLVLLSRDFWAEGGVLIGAGVFVIVFVEGYTSWKMRQPGRKSLRPITQDSLDTFASSADRYNYTETDTISGSGSNNPATRTRGSMASVLEMMSVTLAVMPSSSNYKGPVPLQTETLDDLTATERAARTHPDAPPRLPPLPFTDHAEDMAGILYAPELIAPPPIIWLPNDSAGVARSEAIDLQKYHDLEVTLDVRTKEDVLPRRSSSSRRRSSR
ncbi:hypothetical protein CVT24_008642 [Panaeolus cyanescens]|uniref:CSC1/OSCA1-like 7TM region domain-containing protein n=1 Tax=Panaeolus cyanescens TaxID=181874 RepID=A0A409VCX4_9AGAR|nr:hypothetical protein CVT24_008642 [Panaeolus cyanescens]